MRPYAKVLRGIVLAGQLGFTLITPPVVMALAAEWLQDRFGLGVWVMLLALLTGLLTSGTSAYHFYRRAAASAKKREETPAKKSVTFFNHE